MKEVRAACFLHGARLLGVFSLVVLVVLAMSVALLVMVFGTVRDTAC
jgi:hypothetical protein